jgi:hypothetical protein
MSSPSRTALLRAALPVGAITAFAGSQLAVLAAAGSTLGYDFLAYHAAARRVLEGAPLYQLGHEQAGGFGLFLYPPTFLPLVLPFGLLDPTVASWAWIGAMLVALLAGIWLLPVGPAVRWATLLLAGLSWPVAFTIKLGQVTPLLFLLAVIGWRTLGERTRAGDPVLGASAALGLAIKVQPGLLLAWAALTRRWRALGWGLVTLGVLFGLSLLIAGPAAWPDYATLIRQITNPVTTEHNVTPGTIAYELGFSLQAATALQLLVVAGALGMVLLAAWRASPVGSYLVTLSASQLVSPVLWDHYAMLLLLPVAWLLARRQRWAAAIPLVTSLPLIWLTPPAAYPVTFAVAMAATFLVGTRGRERAARLAEPLPAA